MLEVIDTVKRVSGVDFRVDHAGPRPADPAQIVAQADRAKELLGWQPEFDDLPTIVTDALSWSASSRRRRIEGRLVYAARLSHLSAAQ